MNVTVVSAFGTVGGSEEWILGVLDHARHAVQPRFVVLQDGPFVAELTARGIPATVVPTGPRPWHLLAASRSIRRELRSHRPAVVVGNGVKAQAAAWPAARLGKIPTVWVKHDHSFDGSLARPLGRTATLVVATALEVGEPTGRTDLVVIEPPRPPEPLAAAQAATILAEHGSHGHRPTVAMISRLVPYKGIDVAIDALPDAPGWDLLVIGGPDASAPGEQERLTRLARSRDVSDRVHFAGPIAGAGRLLAAVDCLAVLTRPDPGAPPREGYGIVATEAMLAGIPVIVAGGGAIAGRLLTSTGQAGLVVPQTDPAQTARALRQLSDPAVRHRMGDVGRTVAAGLPDDQDVANRFVAVLERAAA